MKKQWLKAAERYEKSKRPGFKARKRPKKKPGPATLGEFLSNGEGEAARMLLKSSGQDICLGYSETVMSRTIAVVLDGDGLRTHGGVVGVAAAYTVEKPTGDPIDAPKAIEMLRSFPKEGNLLEDHFNEETLLQNIRARLDAIANEAP